MRMVYRSDRLTIFSRRIFLGVFAVVGLALALCSCIAPGDQDAPVARRHSVGFRIIKVPHAEREPLVVAVWYPTNQQATPMKYYLPGRELAADVAQNSLPCKGPFPLVICSHGGGACGISMAVYAEELASSGFVVAGPDHSDEFIACRSDRKTNVRVRDWLKWAHEGSAGVARGQKRAMKFEHRPAEVTATIDALLKLDADPQSPFYGVVDSEKIGMMGVSFGAWTTQAVSGAIPFYHDKRIKAAIPIAGHPGMSSRGTDISRLKVPVMIVFGEEETIVLLDSTSGKKTEGMKRDYKLAQPPKFLIGVKGAKHLHFGGAGMFNTKMGKAFSSREVRLNDPITSVVSKYCIAFFQRYLLDERDAEKHLTESDQRLFLHKAQLGDGDKNAILPLEEEILRHIRTIVQQGIRRPGYPADVWTEDYIAAQFAKFGLEEVHKEEVTHHGKDYGETPVGGASLFLNIAEGAALPQVLVQAD